MRVLDAFRVWVQARVVHHLGRRNDYSADVPFVSAQLDDLENFCICQQHRTLPIGLLPCRVSQLGTNPPPIGAEVPLLLLQFLDFAEDNGFRQQRSVFYSAALRPALGLVACVLAVSFPHERTPDGESSGR